MHSNMNQWTAYDQPTITRATPLPCDLRPLWRIAVLILILDQCRQQRATIEQLHVMNWSIRSRKTQEEFISYLQGIKSPSDVIVRYDPSLSRAIDFALAEGIVKRHEGSGGENQNAASQYRISLSPLGERLVVELLEDSDNFVVEKAFLRDIGQKITQAQISKLFR